MSRRGYSNTPRINLIDRVKALEDAVANIDFPEFEIMSFDLVVADLLDHIAIADNSDGDLTKRISIQDIINLVPPSGISDVQSDPNPTLGNNLDANTFDITNVNEIFATNGEFDTINVGGYSTPSAVGTFKGDGVNPIMQVFETTETSSVFNVDANGVVTINDEVGNPMFAFVKSPGGFEGARIRSHRPSDGMGSDLVWGPSGLSWSANSGNFRFGSGVAYLEGSNGQYVIRRDVGSPQLMFGDHPVYNRIRMNPTGDLECHDGTNITFTMLFDGSIRVAQIADASAANDTLYYSTTAGKLVYKDSGGTVNNLY